MMRKIFISTIVASAATSMPMFVKNAWQQTTLFCTLQVRGNNEIYTDYQKAKPEADVDVPNVAKSITFEPRVAPQLKIGFFVNDWFAAVHANYYVPISALATTTRVNTIWSTGLTVGKRLPKHDAAVMISGGFTNSRNLDSTAKGTDGDKDVYGYKRGFVIASFLTSKMRVDADIIGTKDDKNLHSPTRDLPDQFTMRTSKVVARVLAERYNLFGSEFTHGLLGVKYAHGHPIKGVSNKSIAVIAGLTFDVLPNLFIRTMIEAKIFNKGAFTVLSLADLRDSVEISIDVVGKADIGRNMSSKFIDKITASMIYAGNPMTMKIFAEDQNAPKANA